MCLAPVTSSTYLGINGGFQGCCSVVRCLLGCLEATRGTAGYLWRLQPLLPLCGETPGKRERERVVLGGNLSIARLTSRS